MSGGYEMPDTPTLGKPYCPDCDAEAGLIRDIKEIVYVVRCGKHVGQDHGLDDGLAVTSGAWLSGTTEAGSDPAHNRMSALLSGRREDRAPTRAEGD